MLDYLLWFIIGMGVLWVLLMAHHLGFWPEPNLDRRIGDFLTRAAKRGLTPAEANDEIMMREAMVRVRSRASAWTIRDPWSWAEAIRVSTENEARTLPDRLKPIFMSWAKGLTRSDVLTRQAIDILEAHEKKHEWKNPPWQRRDRSDLDAAMRVK